MARNGQTRKVFICFLALGERGGGWGGVIVGHSRLRQLTGGTAGRKRAAVTDGLGLPARLLISSKEKPETPSQARRAGGGSSLIDALMH